MFYGTSLHLVLGAQDQRLGAEQDTNFLVGPQESLLATVKRRKLAWLGPVTRHGSLSKTIHQGTLEAGRRLSSAEEMLDGQRRRVDVPAHV